MVLSTNISLLSVPGQLYVSQPKGGPNTSQVASYFSALFSVGAIVYGLLLSRQVRGHRRDNIEDDASHLVRLTHVTLVFISNNRDANLRHICRGRVAI